MSRSSIKPVIGITLGDPCGIGPEITRSALEDDSIRQLADFLLIGPARMAADMAIWSNVRGFSVGEVEGSFTPGRWDRASGKAALSALRASVDLIKSGSVTALVTAPLSKEAVHVHDGRFQGHTEFLADAFDVKNVGMMFVGERLKTIIVTRHMALKDVIGAVTQESVLSTILLSDEALKRLFGLARPSIAVCGLNPHAGENGLMGREEIETIVPALERARAAGVEVHGPFPADTIFAQDAGKSYDVIVAMYHDQGLIPVKTISMKKLVNLTIGLPFIRTSPAHGTAFDIAGKKMADATSMKEAIRLAADLARKSEKFENLSHQ